jgi:DNA-directed RNA polymerase subunit M/transcription elongation factor TFIIS
VLEQILLTKEQRKNVTNSTNCKSLYAAVGNRDFWVCTTCPRMKKENNQKIKEEEKKEKEEKVLQKINLKNVGVYDKQTLKNYLNEPIEGTRLTLVEHEPNGHEFTIRMPGLPMRYLQYHDLLKQQFEKVRSIVYKKEKKEEKETIDNVIGRANEENKVEIIESCLLVFYYWVSWAPLTRGSAATGYVFLYSLLLACGLTVQTSPPKNVQ